MSNSRFGVFQSKLSGMMEEPNPRNGFTLTAASSLTDVSPAYSTSGVTMMTITDIYIVDTLPPEPFDPNILAGLRIHNDKPLLLSK